MIFELVVLIVGLIGLWLGSEFTIKGAKNIASHFGITTTFIGLTLLSVGTSIPEIAVSVAGAVDRIAGTETSGIVVGSTVGSAMNQLTLIIGIVALFTTIAVKRRIVWREGIMLLGSVGLLAIMGADGTFSIRDGAIMILVYGFYIMSLAREERIKTAGRRPALELVTDSFYLAGGLLLVIFSSESVVSSSISFAESWGVTQTFVGIFLVGLGTGLPELAVSVSALRNKETEMSVANLIGSNICDLLFSLGVGTMVSGFLVPARTLTFDLPALFLISVFVVYLFRTGLKINRREGIILLSVYIAYLATRLWLFG